VTQSARTLDRLFRTESGPVLATLIRLLGDFQLAEDAFQDAFASAVETWCRDGLPSSPGAWLATTARRKAIDRLRHLRIVEAKTSELALSMRLEREAYPPQIADGAGLVEKALRMGRPGPYQIQGAIAAVHAEAPSAAETDWHQIAVLYEQLLRRERSPVIELNRAVAVSFAVGAVEGLDLLEAIERSAVDHYAPYHLARADMLRRLGRQSEARASYERALPFAQNEQVRRFIERAKCRISETPGKHS
jgi:predicted RNA polymerase sigma factor